MAILRKSLLGIVAAAIVHGAAFAQVDLVKAAHRDLMLNKPDEALAKMQELIKKDLSNEDAFDLYSKIEFSIWENMLQQKNEMGKIVRHVLSLARQGRVALSRDESAIATAVNAAISGASGDVGTREKARVELVNKYGEFAVPALLGPLGNHDEEQGQTNAIMALRQIGDAATLPLIQACASSNPTLRRNIAAVFNLTRDHRAIPVLASLTKDSDAGVVDVATHALRRMGGDPTADPAALYLKQSQEFMLGVGVIGSDHSEVVWSFADGKLTFKDCNASLYTFELAKQSAQRALALDPGSAEAAVLIARSYLAQVAAINYGNIEGVDSKGLTLVAMAMGPKVLGAALEASMRDGQPMVAVAAVEALGATEDKDSLGSSPLLAALGSGNKIVAYAAALALTQASRASNVPQSDKVVAVLAQAAAEQGQQRIVTVGLDQSNEKSVKDAASMRSSLAVPGTFSTVMDTTEKFLTRAISADVIVINEILPSQIPEDLIGILGKDERFKNIKVLVVAKDAEKATERFGDKVAGVIPAGFKAEDLQTKVNEVLADVKDVVKERADAVAVKAADALSTLANNRVDISGAIASLSAQLGRSGQVAINAAKALGEAGTSIDALVGQITAADADVALKVECARAAAKILGRGAAISDAQFEAIKDVAAKGDTDAGLRFELSTALGKANLSPAQRLAVTKALAMQAVGN